VIVLFVDINWWKWSPLLFKLSIHDMTRMVCVNWLVVRVFYMVRVHSSKEIKHGSFIRGTYHAWWIILGVDQHSAVKMLNGMSLVNLID
jgi:hypothetical protein